MTFPVPELVTCNDSPCLHGTCGDSPSGYVCHCEKGYMGTDCGIYFLLVLFFTNKVKKKGKSLFDNDLRFKMTYNSGKT